jgi:hypothetical protein
MAPREDLSTVVKDVLATKGTSQREFAAENLLDYDDFRIQLSRRAFSTAALQAIARLLEIDGADALARHYSFEKLKKGKDEMLSPVQVVGDRIRRSLKGQEKGDLVSNLSTLYAWLKKDDLVVICTLNEPPLEYSYDGWNRLGELYTGAIEREATFLYIRPTQSVFEQYPKKFVGQFFGSTSPDEEILELQSNVIRAGIDKHLAETHIRLHKTEFCPFWSIGMRFGFYSVAMGTQSRDMSLFARFPFGGALSGDSVDKELILLANTEMREAFHAYLSECFSQEDNNLSDLEYALRITN